MIIKIKNLERHSNDNSVIIIYYKAQLVENELIVDYDGSVLLDPPDPNNFIPYENIDETTALSWLMQKIDMNEVQFYLNSVMDALKNPPTKKGIPW
jgi:hypothetical protein